MTFSSLSDEACYQMPVSSYYCIPRPFQEIKRDDISFQVVMSDVARAVCYTGVVGWCDGAG